MKLNRIYPIHLNIFLVLLVVFLPFFSMGHTINHVKYLDQRIHDIGAEIILEDPLENSSQHVISREVFVNLIYGRENLTDIAGSDWQYRVEFQLFDSNDNPLGVPGFVTIEKGEAEGVYHELKSNSLSSSFVRLEITAVEASIDGFQTVITDLNGIHAVVPEDIRLELEMEVQRYDTFDKNFQIQTSHNFDDADWTLEVYWEFLEGAESYQLEWVFQDELEDGAGSSSFDKAVRIETTDNHYKFPISYPKGTVSYRIRPVGRFINTEASEDADYPYLRYGNWSVVGSELLNLGFEETYNWQTTTTFAEDGKFKKVISYFDDGLRNRQTQTNLSTEEQTLVATSHYDVEGRPTLNILPVPSVDNNDLFYKANFNISNTENTTYNRKNFDKELGSQCSASLPDPLSSQSGASKYFSPENTGAGINNFIPDAELFPMTQMRYTNDGTGRVSTQGGVGLFYQLGSEHETKYYYDDPSSVHLGRLFGSNVGDPKFYKRNLVVDANGQISASYIDAAGRVVATSLVGNVPENVKGLESAFVKPYAIEENLMEQNNWNSEAGTSIVLTDIFNEESGTQISIEYDYEFLKDYFEENGENICFSCDYELDIKVIDPCGEEVDLENLNDNCQDLPATFSGKNICNDFVPLCSDYNFDFVMETVGNYQIYKSLKVIPISEEDLETKIQDLLPDFQSVLGLIDIDFYNCAIDCETTCAAMLASANGWPIDPVALADCIQSSCAEDTPPSFPDDNFSFVQEAECISILNQIMIQISPEGCIFENEPNWWEQDEIYDRIESEGVMFLLDEFDASSGVPITDPTLQANLQESSTWNNDWAGQLAIYHPEYQGYIECQESEKSRMFDINFFSMVLDFNFPSSETEAENVLNAIYGLDPMFSVEFGFYPRVFQIDGIPTEARNNISDELEGPIPANMANELIEKINTKLLNGFKNCSGDDSHVFEFIECSSLDPDDTDALWDIFKSIYYGEKLKLRQSLRFRNISDDPPSNEGWYPYLDFNFQDDPCTDVQIIEPTPILDITTGEDLVDYLNDNLNDINPNYSSCVTVCEQRAYEWYTELVIYCPEIATLPENEIESIIDAFKDFCNENCEDLAENNNMGFFLDPNNLGADLIPLVSDFLNNLGCDADGFFNFITSSWNEVYTTILDDGSQICKSFGDCLASMVLNIYSNDSTCPTSEIQLIDDVCSGSTIGYYFDNTNNALIIETNKPNFCCETLEITIPSNVSSGMLCENLDNVSFSAINNEYKLVFQGTDGSGLPTLLVGEISCQGPITSFTPGSNGPEQCATPNSFSPSNTSSNNLSCLLCENCLYVPKTNTITISDCVNQLIEEANLIAETLIAEERNKIIEEVLSEIKCDFNFTEEFTAFYASREHHYTLYYYDQAGSLVQTVPPIGVNPLPISDFPGGVWNENMDPAHTQVTQYQYNTLGQVIWQNSPDGGETNFRYDHAQRLRFSENAKQKAMSPQAFSFTKYDDEGRISAVGEMFASNTEDFENVDVNDLDFPILNGGFVNPLETTETFYNTPDNVDPNFVQTNLRGRVAETSNHNMQTKYSYDEHGNVKELRHNYNQFNIDNNLNHDTQIEYDYDLISGNVKEVAFQKDQLDQFTHRYEYDADNRLTYVYTSDDGIVFDRDARYFYYQHGPLARVEVGTDNVQGMDYYYTLQGWIKGVNLPDLAGPGNEPGKDGIIGDGIPSGINRFVAKDEMAYTLGYHTEDYKPIQSTVANGVLNSSTWNDFTNGTTNGLYNGNIAWMVTDIDHFKDEGSLGAPTGSQSGMVYQYDQLHRIINSKSFSKNTYDNTWAFSEFYNSTYSYDANGNLQTLGRFAPRVDAGGLLPAVIDLMVYSYGDNDKPNQLTSISDNGNSNNLPYGDFQGQSADNYEYDEIGNLIQDNEEEIEEILWTVYGKVREVKFTSGSGKSNIKYTYDPAGNRLTKQIGSTVTLYARDASGNVMGIYDRSPGTGDGKLPIVSQKEVPLYGSSRIGLQKFTDRTFGGGTAESTTQSFLIGSIRGQKYYEQSNHLGNILATVTDLKVGLDTNTDGFANSYESQVASATDYYAFGWEMPGRKYNSDKYRYGFNGKEKDQNGEFGSITNYDYGFRIFNPATGRFLSVDPLMSSYPYYTPYQFAGNKPIAAIDLDGLEEEFKYDVYEKMKGGDYSRPKLFQGTQVEIYKKAVENVVVGLNNPTFDYSDEVNLKAAEEKVIYFLSNQITPTKGALTQELIETEAAIKGQTIGALFSGDSEQENKAVNTIKLSSKFLWNTPIANFADVIIPTSATLKLIKNAPVNIALGLRNYMGGDANTLFRFAKSVGALEVDQWAKLGVNMTKSFQNSFKEVTDLVIQSGGKIKFDITSINLKEARAVKGKGLYDEGVGYTQWELNQILDSPKLLKNTEFFENGAKVSTEEVIKKAGG